MKAYKLFAAATIATMSLASCQDDNQALMGEGNVVITPTISTDLKVASRSDNEALKSELAESFVLWISNDKGVVRQYNGLDNIPSSIPLLSGQYVAEAWAGESVPASWESRWFTAEVPFSVTAGASTPVDVKCKIANVVVSVEYAPDVDEVLKDYTLEVGHSRGHLTFDEEHIGEKAYFVMPSADKNLSWTLTGTKRQDGTTLYTRTNIIADVQPGHEYIFKISCASTVEGEIGGGFLDIQIDDTVIEIEDNIEISVAPIVKVDQFDIDELQHMQPAQVGKISASISGSNPIASLQISCDQLQSIIGETSFDAIGASEAMISDLKLAGIYCTYPNGNNSLIRIIFDEDFTNTYFVEGEKEYQISIKATDESGMTANKAIRIQISDTPYTPDPIVLSPVDTSSPDFTYDSVVLSCQIAHPEAIGENIAAKFYYTEGEHASRAAWNSVDAVVDGNIISAKISDLKPNTNYSYYAEVTGSLLDEPFQTEILTFVTSNAPQLDNSGFEDWDTSSTPYLLYARGGEMFWDSGNHGSATMRKNITIPDSEIKHSGNYSAKLASQFVGIGSLGKFAAGNAFVGKYLGTDGTDGILGFGRPFAHRPVSLDGWVKYVPGTVKYTNAGAPDIVSGELDKGIIYIALLDDYTEDYNGESFPVIIKTKAANRQLFDKQSEHVIAYGELIFDAATDGDGMVQFSIPLEYRSDATPAHIMVVASASKGGDFFAGGPSTMWIDDFELKY